MSRSQFLVLVSSLVYCVAVPAAADPTREWPQKVKKSAALLKAGEYDQSLRITDRIISEMVDLLGPGDGSMQSFGIVLTHKALANAGLGRFDDALWYWHMVLGLYPGLATADLSAYGAAGKFLKDNFLSPPTEPRPTQNDPDISPAVPLRTRKPQFPRGAQAFGVEGHLIVDVVITPAGTVTYPRILKSLPVPTLSYVALEALRKWRFEPARKNGEPIASIFNLTVNYTLR